MDNEQNRGGTNLFFEIRRVGATPAYVSKFDIYRLAIDGQGRAFCLENGKNYPESGTTVELSREKVSKGVHHILWRSEEGLHDNSAVNDYITQYAIWSFNAAMGFGAQLSDSFINAGEAITGLKARINRLVEEAVAVERGERKSSVPESCRAVICSSADQSGQRVVFLLQLADEIRA